MQKTSILYLQLPLLDNDATGERENFAFAGAYLDHALRRSPEAPYIESRFAPTHWDDLDTPRLSTEILRSDADLLACTLYLWNIERTIDLARRLKQAKPDLRILVGGPEVARNHPLLENAPFDAIVYGEGEGVFPKILTAWRNGTEPDFQNVAIPTSAGWRFGRHEPPEVNLADAQPDEVALMACIQNRPVIFVETVRGCPLSCSYCRYYQIHSGLRTLSVDQVINRIRRFRELGATEIRFVDPTFNARKNFTELLKALARLNTDKRLSFFAEIRADTLTAEQAALMAEAHFSEVEIGVQSIDPQVLKNVCRPHSIRRLERGIRALCESGVRTTLDVMYGLPQQTIDDVEASLDWCLAFGENAQVQCMQTLILPGTTLRTDATKWQLESGPPPPYGITRTPTLSPEDICSIEILLDEHPNLPADPVTPRFCGQRLPGLFKARHRITTEQLAEPIPGKASRRAITISDTDLFAARHEIGAFIERATQHDPFALWQFVLEPQQEEPLDLLDHLIAVIQRQPPHLLDRFASASAFGLIVSRRLFVRTTSSFSREWCTTAESLLREAFG
ncbi:MAG: radical SAM protein [Pontiellaceae bacterium]|nr:radical SAM protein [Pontiellaceae bacterium]MBN2785918.1 radical SAM protein [Pontiellaceae bacterium]